MSTRSTVPVNVLTVTADPTVPSLRAGDLVYNSTTGRLRLYNGSSWADVSQIETLSFFSSGVLTVSTGQSRIYTEGSYAVDTIRASVGTPPTGASVIVDVKKNGTSIYSGTPANRPTIAAGSNTALGGAPTTSTFAAGDYITIDVSQVGSTFTGTDLTLVMRLRRTS